MVVLAVTVKDVACPFVPVVTVIFAELPNFAPAPVLVPANITIAPLTGLPPESSTVTMRGLAKVMFTIALCGVPLAKIVTKAGVPAVLLSEKVAAGVTPETLAVILGSPRPRPRSDRVGGPPGRPATTSVDLSRTVGENTTFHPTATDRAAFPVHLDFGRLFENQGNFDRAFRSIRCLDGRRDQEAQGVQSGRSGSGPSPDGRRVRSARTIPEGRGTLQEGVEAQPQGPEDLE